MNYENVNGRKVRTRFYYIYKISFLCGEPEGRYYIGKRTYFGSDIESDNYTGSGHFCSAYFKKYGSILGKTYNKEILEINETQEINQEREIYWVGKLYKSDPLCMNLVAGGAGNAIHEIQCYVQDQYKKDINQYSLDGKYIQTWHGIREASRQLAVSRTGITACLSFKKPSAFGFIWRYYDGTTNDIVLPETNRKPVNQYTLEGVFIKRFLSEADALKSLEYKGAHIDLIGKCCRRIKNHGSAHGFIWRFDGDTVTEEDLNLRRTSYSKRNFKTKAVRQLTNEGVIINQFASITEAQKKTGVRGSAITEVCKHNAKRKTAGGFKWEYVENEQ